jgi:hypothetical protein
MHEAGGPMIRKVFLLSGLFLLACGGTDSGDAGPRSDIRDGDLDSLTIDAEAWGPAPAPFGGIRLIHSHGFTATCPINAAELDDRRDSATLSLVEVDSTFHTVFSIWFAGRSRCREAGAMLAAARTGFAGYGFADSTEEYTKIVYHIRGGASDSLRVGADVIQDSVSFPGLSILVRQLEGAFTP